MLLKIKKIWLSFFCLAPLLIGIANASENFWIDLNTECMLDGTCKFKAYEATDIRKGNRDTSAMGFLQDAVLAPVIFIGTLVTVALIVSGLLYVFSGAESSLKSKAKNGITYSIVGLVVVMLSLVIIRFVQFLARWGS